MGLFSDPLESVKDLGYKPCYDKILREHGWQCKVGEFIGSGGFARVYKMIDLSTDNTGKVTGKLQEYVLKIIDGKRNKNGITREAINREIEIMEKLNDCGYTAQLIDHIEANVCERIMGDENDNDLSICILKIPMYKAFPQRKTLKEKEVIRMGIDICEAVKAMVAHEIVHRDMTPKNIFFDSARNRYILGDFGISKEAQEIHNTYYGENPCYAPEHYNHGLREELRNRLNAELYSLAACMALFLGCGTLEERSDYKGMDTVLAIEALEDTNRVSTALLEVIRKGLRPYDRRYQTADEMQADLRAIWAYMERNNGECPKNKTLDELKGFGTSSAPQVEDYAERARNALRNGEYMQARMLSKAGYDAGSTECTTLLAYSNFLLIRLGLLDSTQRVSTEQMLEHNYSMLEMQLLHSMQQGQREKLMLRAAQMKYLLAVSKYETGNVEKFRSLAESAADQGSVIACYVCGRGMYAGDRPFTKNMSRGWNYLMRAAEAGYGAALAYVKQVQRNNPGVHIPAHIRNRVSTCELSVPKHQLEDILQAM